jgi:hypothetical protein
MGVDSMDSIQSLHWIEGVELKCVLHCVEHVFVLEGLICNKLSDRLGNIAPYRMRRGEQ